MSSPGHARAFLSIGRPFPRFTRKDSQCKELFLDMFIVVEGSVLVVTENNEQS